MKKVSLILISILLMLTLAACGDKCAHTYAGDCDRICDECGETREATAAHTYFADCDEACDECGEVREATAEHNYYGDCDAGCHSCGADREVTVEHSWKPATCTAGEACEGCGAVKSEPLGHTPTEDDGDCTTPVTCGVCGVTITPANDHHTGGTATCTEKASCTACGTVYGELAPDNHIDENTDHICDRGCGTTNIGTHTDSENDDDHTCDYGCGAALEAHEGGTATCVGGKLCEICGVEYDLTKNPENHASDNYTYADNGDGTHTKTHECGVTVGEPEDHTIENHLCTACGAMEIVVSFDADDYEWKTGDELYFCRVSRDNQWEEYCFTATVAEDGTVTWTPDKTLYWDGTGEHRLFVSYPCTAVGWDDFAIPSDQSEAEKLREADLMNARWAGTPTTNVIEFELKHRMAKITVNYAIASQFDSDAPVIAEIYSNAKYCIFSDADGLPIITSVGQYDAWIIPYHNDNQFTAYVAPGEYNTDGMFKFYIGDAEVQIEITNPGAVTLEEGGEYTFDVKVGQDVITIAEVSMGDIDSPFGDGWHNEIDLKAIGTQDIGKTTWEVGDQIIVIFTSPRFGTQYGTLTYDGNVGSWSTDVSFSYLEGEIPTVSAIYAPCYEVVDGNMQLKDGMQLGMTEYISAACSITDGTLNISFEGVTRNYSRLRISALPGQTLTVNTTGFTPAGATEAANDVYTLTADENGNTYLYGTFAVGATVSVKQGEVTLEEYTFTAEKHPDGTKSGINYALDARLVIDLSQYSDGDTINITQDCKIVGDGNEYNRTLNISADAAVIFEVGASGVKLNGQITVADGKTLTLLVAGDAEHTVNGGISLGNGSNVIIEGDLTKANNKLTVTATDGKAGIGANGGVTAGDITIRNARVDATGSSREAPEFSTPVTISGAAIGTSDGSMGDILIENSIIVAEGGYYESTSHAAAIGIGYVGSTMGDIILKNSQITARNNGDGLASVIGAGANMHVDVTGTLGDIVITNTELNLSMEIGTTHYYAALIGSGVGKSYAYVNMGKIIFTDMKQEELDEVIPTWLPSDFNQYGAYALGIGYEGIVYKCGTFGGVWVSDGNGGTVQIGDESGYHNPE